MPRRSVRLKSRARLGVAGIAMVAVIAGGVAGVGALTGFFGGSGSESADLTEGLVGHWDLEEAGGALVNDRSGNSNTGMFQDGTSGNPVSYWTFDERSGTTAADSIGSNDGTLGGDGSGSDVPSWTSGTIGDALEFDGSDDFVEGGNSGMSFESLVRRPVLTLCQSFP